MQFSSLYHIKRKMRFIRNFKLEEFCLNIILENLEKYIYNQNIPQMHIDFLHRLYSEDIFQKYSTFRHVSEDCMLWFLNPYSKKITLCTVSEKTMNHLQIVGSTITSLSLRESLSSENMINSIICCVPHVTHLDLSSSLCSDKTLLCIQRMCPLLITLNLYDCDRVTDDGMVNLCGSNQSLRNLNLIGTSVEFCGLHDILKGMPLLQCLKYYEMADALYYIHEWEFKANAYHGIHYNLTELIYESEGMHDPSKVLFAWTVLCPNVKKVHIEFSATENMLHMCSKFENLEDLKIRFSKEKYWFEIMHPYDVFSEDEPDEDVNYVSDYAIDVLAPFILKPNKLTTLNLCRVKITITTLIHCYKNVNILNLQSVSFTDFVEKDLKLEDNKLEALYIKDVCLTAPVNYKAILCLLSASKNVTKLYINHVKDIPQEIFDVILNSMKNLSFVDFSFTPIKSLSVLRFMELPSMKAIYLDACCNISLAKNSDLKKYVQQCACTLSWRYLDEFCDDSDDDESENYSFIDLY